ncbi:MAG: aspartate aminotransferase family protein, partial [Actinobacteria bacterium]|nr:aspartate aminotransferase family protein [Actinomycetota bacterium]
ELVKDKDSRATFNDEESERLLRGYLSKAMFERGLICRADDRGDPVVQFAPPLISTTQEIDFLVEVMREVLTEGHRKI